MPHPRRSPRRPRSTNLDEPPARRRSRAEVCGSAPPRSSSASSCGRLPTSFDRRAEDGNDRATAWREPPHHHVNRGLARRPYRVSMCDGLSRDPLVARPARRGRRPMAGPPGLIRRPPARPRRPIPAAPPVTRPSRYRSPSLPPDLRDRSCRRAQRRSLGYDRTRFGASRVGPRPLCFLQAEHVADPTRRPPDSSDRLGRLALSRARAVPSRRGRSRSDRAPRAADPADPARPPA